MYDDFEDDSLLGDYDSINERFGDTAHDPFAGIDYDETWEHLELAD